MAHPTSASSSTSSAIPKITSMQILPKPMFKLINSQTLASSSVVTPTTGLTHYLKTVPLDSLLNKSDFLKIQTQTVTHESPSVTVPTTSSMQHMSTIVPSLDSSIIHRFR